MLRFRDYCLLRLNEVDDNVADDLESWLEDNPDLPFDDLFGGKMRVVIPFGEDRIATGILEKLENLGLLVNFEHGVVFKGDSPKKRMRLGKLILGKKSPFTNDEKRWWNHQGNPLQALNLASQSNEYAIIISRHPIDVVRMSDHDGWTSCHAPPEKYRGLNYFHCAISDAKGGGAVAYVVKRKDAKRAMESTEWDDGEIFEDDDRGVDGISPLSRVRLRMFVHKDNDYDLAVPEVRSYGRNIPGFNKTVSQWALENQQDKLNGDRPSMKDFYRMGGSYQDSSDADLFNQFFGDNLDHGNTDYKGSDDGTMYDIYQQEINALNKKFPQTNHKYAWAWANVEHDGNGAGYVYVGLDMSIKFPQKLLVKQLPNWNTPEYKQLTKIIKEIIDEHGHTSVSEIEFQEDSIDIRFDVTCTDYYGNYIEGNPDCYQEALNDAKELEKKGPKIERLIYLHLIKKGYINHSIYSHMDDWDYDEPFKNFEWEEDLDDEGEIYVRLGGYSTNNGNIYIGDLPTKHDPKYDRKSLVNYTYRNLYQEQFKKFSKLFADRLVKLAQAAQQGNQLYLWPNMKKKPLSYNLRPDINLLTDYDGNVFMELNFTITPTHTSNDVDEAVEFIRYLDGRVNLLIQEAQRLWQTVIYQDVVKQYQRLVKKAQTKNEG